MPPVPSALPRILLASLLLATAGCGSLGSWLRPAPTPILPPEELYKLGEQSLEKRTYAEAREAFKKIVERHPTSSYAARGRFLLGRATTGRASSTRPSPSSG